MKNKKMLPPTYLFLAIVIMTVLHFLLPVAQIVPFPWNLLGILPFLGGCVLNAFADRAFKKVETTVKPFEESQALVTDGVFRLTRNPMYVGFVLILLGIALFAGSLSAWLIVLLFPLFMDRIYIQVEERMLEETFGAVWLKYKNGVRRWI